MAKKQDNTGLFLLLGLAGLALLQGSSNGGVPFIGGVSGSGGGLPTSDLSNDLDPTTDEDIGTSPITATAPQNQLLPGQQLPAQTIQTVSQDARDRGTATFGITAQPVAIPSMGPAATPANIGVVARAGYVISGGRNRRPTIETGGNSRNPRLDARTIGELARGGFVVSGRNENAARVAAATRQADATQRKLDAAGIGDEARRIRERLRSGDF